MSGTEYLHCYRVTAPLADGRGLHGLCGPLPPREAQAEAVGAEVARASAPAEPACSSPLPRPGRDRGRRHRVTPLTNAPHIPYEKLRELRFHLGRRRVRSTYFIATAPRIILLTVFAKTRSRERDEIRRARAAKERCLAEAHTVDGGGDL
ncbi:MAG: type II toxin-antitoxin system RelE/ParE family toxin [Dehalococcoidia bacterium]